MVSREKLNDAWFKIVDKNTPRDFTVVFSEELIGENRPEVPKPYITLKLISGPTPIGADENLRQTGGKRTLSSLRQFTVSLQAFGAGAHDALASLNTLLYGSKISAKLKELADIAIVNRGQVADISALKNVGFERRANLDVIFNVANNQVENEDVIETAVISGGEIIREDCTIKQVSDITISKPEN